MLVARDITKIYKGIDGENRVLDGLDFHGKKGEFCIITGRSGCGKSTLLNVLSGLDSADSGQLEICGKALDGSQTQLCRIRRNDTAFIFQGYNLISNMTAAENVELGLKYRKVPRAKRRVMAHNALAGVGLGDRVNYLPHQLSGGQQQRVAIARATV
ncbi:MAG: ATP-binding cassette domain-containing protein, partial [Oscillospiraceae bacterium]|nr:ATP-binding cassette domain-containing protein [Oscillospiraceae bacterium]